jgi:fibronectin-binding autotransporter adhesin
MMNKIFRVVWNASLGRMVVACELAKRFKRGSGKRGSGVRSRCAAAVAAVALVCVAPVTFADGRGGNNAAALGGNGSSGGAGGGGGTNGVGGTGSALAAAGQNGSNGNGGAGSAGGTASGGTSGTPGAGGSVGSAGNPVGGNGGDGGDALCGACTAGIGASGGGGGGDGVNATSLDGVIGPILGGSGGNGGSALSTSSSGADGGSGGGAGAGAVIVGGGSTSTSANITGGRGGNAGSSLGGGGAGFGGGGGSGLVSTGVSITNAFAIQGGDGGNGGNGAQATHGRSGGLGGAGIAGSSLTLNNTGIIQGGNGGTTGLNPNAGTPGATAAGGAGVQGTGLQIINAGTIAGGMNGNNTVRANAISFTGGVNSLTLLQGWGITGNVAGTGTNTLILGGDVTDLASDPTGQGVSTILNVSQIGTGYQGFGSFQKTGASTWQLLGSTTAVTPWTIAGGTLQMGNDALGGATGALTVQDGSTLATTGTFGMTRATTLGAGTAVFDVAPDTSLTMGGVISGAGALNKTNTGTLVLTGTNTYGGITTISAGTLQVGAGGTTGAIVGDVTNNGTLAFSRSNAYAFSGLISGTGALNKLAAGVTTLSADNTYSGGTTISGGTLQLGSGGTTGSIIGDVTNNGVLSLNRSNAYTFAGVISGTGALTKLAAGTTTLTADNTYAGTTTISAGTLQLGEGGTTGSITGNVVNNGALAFNRSDDTTFGGVISGTGTLSQISNSILTLTGTNTYAGGTTVAGGTVSVGANANLGATAGAITLDGGTLQATAGFAMARAMTLTANSGTVQTDTGVTLTNSGVISGASGALTKSGEGTLVLTGASTYGGITTISAGTLQLGAGATTGAIVGDVTNNGTLAFNRSNAYTFAGLISGTGAVTKLAAGTTTLTADNTYSGGTTISAGTLQLGSGGTTGSVVGDVINNATLTFNRSNANTFGGVISGTGAVTKLAAGTTTLTGENTYAGITTITGGTLQLGEGGTTGSITGNVVNNAILAFNRSDDISFDGVISGTGSVRQIGGGITTLAGTNTYSGGTAITAGTVSVGANANLGAAAGAVTLDGGTLQTRATFTTARAMSITGNNGTLQTDAGTTLTANGIISGTTGALTKTGEGTLVLTANNTYAGGTTISAGILSVAANLDLGAAAGTVTLDGGTLATTASFTTARGMSITGNNGSIQTAAGTTLTASGVIAGPAGALTKAGDGTLLLTGDSTYSGGTTIAAGTLQLGSGGTTGSIQGDVVNNGTVTFNRSNAVTFTGAISGAGTVNKLAAGVTTLTGDNTYTGGTTITAGTLRIGDGGTTGSIAGNITNNATLEFNRSAAMSYAGAISGTGTLNHTGSGVTTFTGGPSSVGRVNVTGGTLDLAQAGTFAVADDYTTAIGATTSMAAGSTLTVGDVFTQTAGSTLDIELGGVQPAISARTANIGGTLRISGFNASVPHSASALPGASYTILHTAAPGGIVNDFSNVLMDGSDGTADYLTVGGGKSANAQDYNVGFALTWTAGATLGNGVFTLDDAADGFDVDVVLADQAPSATGWDGTTLTKQGLGTLVLSSANTYTGPTLITAGTLRTGIADAFASSSAVNVAGGATLDLDSFNQTANNLAGAGAITLGSAILSVNDSTDTSLSGVISGSGSLIKTGAATLTLAGDSTYTGGTTISAGTLQLGVGGTTGAITGNVVNDGALVFNRSDDIDFVGDISGSGSLTQLGAGTTTLTGSNSYAGGTTISAGALQLGDGAASGAIIGDVLNNGALLFNRSDDQFFAGAISGTGTVTQVGTGTTTLTADNTYGGGTTILAGTLQLGDGNTTGAITGNVANDGALAFNRSDDVVFAGTISGTGAVTHLGSGTTTFTAGNTYSGGTTISQGTLQLGNGGTTGSLVGDITNNGALVFSRSDALTHAGAITGVGSLTQAGTGVLTLTNAGSSVGNATVAAGTLALAQAGAFTVSGDYLTAAGATTQIAANATLGVGNVFTQVAGSTLNVDIGSAQPIISAASADIGGTLNITGFSAGVPTSASALPGALFNLISTTNGIANDFASVSFGSAASPVDYLTLAGSKSADQLSYDIGFGLTWLAGATTGDGSFTLTNPTDSFNVDVVLADQSASASGWDGTTLTKNGAGTLVLSAANTYTGPTLINAGTLRTGIADTFAFSSAVTLASGATLDLDNFNQTANNFGGAGNITLGSAVLTVNDGADTSLGGVISGSGGLVKTGAAMLTLTGNNSYTGGTTINDGTLQIGDGGTTGSILGDVANAGTLAFNRSDALTFGGILSGSGVLNQLGAGTTVLTGNSNAFSGNSVVSNGTLQVDGTLGAATSTLSVSNGGTLAGHGTVGGNVSIADGILSPGASPGTLTINGDLALAAASTLNYEFGQAGVVGGPLNDLTVVGGDLTLDGTLNVTTTSSGSFGAGLYRIIDYAGSLTDNGLVVGAAPSSSYFVQTSVANQVNLVNTDGLTLGYWDGAAGPRNNNLINGGSGLWQSAAGNDNWTTLDGAVNAPFSNAAFAVFTAAPGTVDVDNSLGAVTASGMQFASSGYVLQGDAITLVETDPATPGVTTVRVGDGTGAGASQVATINAVLTGVVGVEKSDLGTLVLGGANTYTGGTTIAAGALQLGNGGTSGSISGDVIDNGTLVFNRSDDIIFAGAIAGSGGVSQIGSGVVVLTSDNAYAGPTSISAGTLQLGNGGATGSIIGTVDNAGRLTFNRSNDMTLAGAITGAGSVNQIGAGRTTLTADSAYTGGTLISAGILQLGDGGATGAIVGDVVNNGELVFNRNNAMNFAGAITGSGVLTQAGSGTTTLTSAGSSVASAGVTAGVLSLAQTGNFTVAGDYTTASGATTQLAADATLGVGDAFAQSAGSTLNVALGSAQPVISAASADIGGTLNITGFNASLPGSASALPGALFTVIRTTAGIANDFSAVNLGGASSPVDYLTLAGAKSANTLDYNVGFGLTWTAGTTFGNGVFTLTDPADSFNVDVALADQAASATGWDGTTLTKGGQGTLLLSAANTYTGPTLITAGTLRTAAANAFVPSSAVNVAGGATLDLDSFNQSASNLAGAGAITLGSAVLTVIDDTDTTFSGVISGSGSLLKSGAATLTLAGDNTYTGTTTISTGTLQLGAGGTTGSITGDVINNGALVFNRSDATQFAGNMSGSGALTQAGTGTTTLTRAGASVGDTNVTAGMLDLAQAGIFTSTGSYTTAAGATTQVGEDTTLNVGGLFTQAAGSALNIAFEGPQPVIVAASADIGGTLDITGFRANIPASASALNGTLFNIITTTGGITNDFASVVVDNTASPADYLTLAGGKSPDQLTYNVGFGLTWLAGPTLGNGMFTLADAADTFDVDLALANQSASTTGWDGTTLTKEGPGTLVLSAANTYTGPTLVRAGTLRGGIIDAFITSSSVSVASSATLDLDSVNQTANLLSGAGSVLLGAATLTATTAADTTFDGVISGSGGVIKSGASVWTLTGGNVYTGGTTISAGTLQLGNGGSGGQIVGDVLDDAVLAFNRSDAITFAGAISGTGSLRQLGTGTTVLTGNSTYAGGTTVAAGTLQLGGGGTTGSITGDVIDDGVLAFNRSDATAFTGVISGAGAVTQLGTGTTTLTAGNTYLGGTTIAAGTLQLGSGGTSGSIAGNVIDNGTLAFNRSDTVIFTGQISGVGGVAHAGTGRTVLTADHTYAGGTSILGGTLQIGDGGSTGSIVGNVVDNGTLVFDRADSFLFGGALSGAGTLQQVGTGISLMTGNSGAFTGSTSITSGTLRVDGILGAASSQLTVASGGRLSGNGTVGGTVSIIDGVLAPGTSPGTLTIGGDLTLGAGAILDYEFGQAGVVGGAFNDLTVVGGDLTLDGVINVTASSGGVFGPGLYRIISYGGALTDSGLVIGTVPGGSDTFVNTALAGQVNLVNTAGLTLNYWDGDVGAFNGQIDGGSGVWQSASGNLNWTDATGDVNAGYADGDFAIFAGASGAVTVDTGMGQITSTGMQFASNGYRIQGDPLTLLAGSNVLRVGDGTGPGRGYVATIASVLDGVGGVDKTDGGTLVLTGANSYTGGTTVTDGTLQLGDGNSTGSIVGNVTDNGVLAFNNPGVTTFAGIISGTGTVQQVAGTTVLVADNAYTGGTAILGGTLTLGNGGTTGSIVGNVANNGTLVFNRSDAVNVNGAISGAGSVTLVGTGTTTLTAANTYTGGTTIAAGTLRVGDGGTSGSIVGNVSNTAALAFNRSDMLGYAGTITGGGSVTQLGSGTTTLTGTGSTVGSTQVVAGTLALAQAGAFNVTGDYSTSSGAATQIAAGSTLVVGGVFAQAAGSSLNVALGGPQPMIAAGSAAIDGTLGVTGFSASLPTNASALTGTQFNLIRTTGGIVGDFSAVTFGGASSAVDYLVLAGTKTANQLDYNVGLGLTWRAGPTVGNGIFTVQDAVSAFNVDVVLDDQAASATGWDGMTLTKMGAGTLRLSAANTYTGSTQISAGVLQGGAVDAFAASSAVSVGTGATLDLNNYNQVANNLTGAGNVVLGTAALTAYNAADTRFDGTISGAGSLIKAGPVTLTLTGANTYTGGTTISAGTLQLGDGGSSGSIAGDVVANGTLAFNRADVATFAGAIGGAGTVNQVGTGTTRLTGDSSAFGGTTNITQGTLLVNETLGTATSTLVASTGGTLGGTGTVGGNVALQDGILAPGASVGTLGIGGDLSLTADSVLNLEFGEAGVVGGQFNDLVVVGGDVTLDGTLNVLSPAGGNFDPGVYRIIDYTGTLANNGLDLGVLPRSTPFFVQTDFAGQVNLVNTLGLTFEYWDGSGPRFDGVINGGDGAWQGPGGNDNWTETNAAVNGPFADGAFAVFGGQAGTVTVDNSLGAVNVAGMQFATDGYRVQGDAISLVAGNNVIRVGDGTQGTSGFTATIDAPLVGSGTLDKADIGTLVLTGSSSYTGGTIIGEGVLQLGAGGSSGSILGPVANDGVLAFNRSDAATFAGNISGAGTVIQQGAGSTTLTGTNSYSGGTHIAGGTLVGSASSFGTGAVENAAALVIDQPSDAAFANAINGTGSLTKTGAGRLDFTSASTLSGPTTVAAGVLAVNGSLASSAVDVLGGASLAGGGMVGSTVIRTGATIAPGNSIGTLSITGNLIQAGGSTYQVQVDPGSTASDLIRISGAATLENGAGLNVTKVAAGEYSLNSRYTVLTASQGVTGTYTLSGDVDGAFFRLEDTYDAGNVYLTPVQVRSFLGAGNTPNEIATARALQTLPDGHSLKDAVGFLSTDLEARNAFNQLSGEIHASARTQLNQDARFAREAATERLYQALCVVGAAPDSRQDPVHLQALRNTSCEPDDAGGWTRVFGAWGRTDGDGNAAELERSIGGVLVGTDVPMFDTWRVGALLGYSRASIDVDDRHSSANSRNYHLGVYAGSQVGNLGVRLGAVHALHELDTLRQVTFANVSERLDARYSGDTTQVFGELGYRIDLHSVQLEPFAAVAHVRQSTDAFREHGGAAALSGRSQRTETTFSTLGLHAATELSLGSADWRARATIGWRHAFNAPIPTAVMSFSDSSRFLISGVPIAEDVAIIEAGVEASFARNGVFSASYTGQFGDGLRDSGVEVRLAWTF